MSETTTLPEGSRWQTKYHWNAAHFVVREKEVFFVERDGTESPATSLNIQGLAHMVSIGEKVPFALPLPAPQAEPPDDGWFLVSETRDKIPVSTGSVPQRVIGFFPELIDEKKPMQDGTRVGFWWGEWGTPEGANGKYIMSHWRPWPAPPKGAK